MTTSVFNPFLCQYWDAIHCDPDQWTYVPSDYGVKGVTLVGGKHMKLFSELNNNWKNPGRRNGTNIGEVEKLKNDIISNGINTNGSVIYYDVETGERVNGDHRRQGGEDLGIPGWMAQAVKFDSLAAKIRFATVSNNRKNIQHNNTSINDVESCVRELMKIEGEYSEQQIIDEVHCIGWHIPSTTRQRLIDKFIMEMRLEGSLKPTERYSDYNEDKVKSLFKNSNDSWIKEYYENDDEITIYINVANIESRVGSILKQNAIARQLNKPLHIVFTVPVPHGKETLESKRQKFWSTHIVSVEDRILESVGMDKNIFRGVFMWNHPDCEHRTVAQDNENEDIRSLIKFGPKF